MSFTKWMVRWALLICMLAMAQVASARPVRCSYGYQDSSCPPNLVNAPQPQPQCPGSAGWTTTAASQWIGSQWSAPSCNYQAPPTCGSGTTQTSPPVWNGSSWSAPGCTPIFTGPTVQQQADACNATARMAFGPYDVPWSGPVTSQGFSASGPILQQWINDEMSQFQTWPLGALNYIGTPDPSTTYDMFYGPHSYFCWLNQGTTNVAGFAYQLWCGPNGGAQVCGGGGQ